MTIYIQAPRLKIPDIGDILGEASKKLGEYMFSIYPRTIRYFRNPYTFLADCNDNGTLGSVLYYALRSRQGKKPTLHLPNSNINIIPETNPTLQRQLASLGIEPTGLLLFSYDNGVYLVDLPRAISPREGRILRRIAYHLAGSGKTDRVAILRRPDIGGVIEDIEENVVPQDALDLMRVRKQNERRPEAAPERNAGRNVISLVDRLTSNRQPTG